MSSNTIGIITKLVRLTYIHLRNIPDSDTR